MHIDTRYHRVFLTPFLFCCISTQVCSCSTLGPLQRPRQVGDRNCIFRWNLCLCLPRNQVMCSVSIKLELVLNSSIDRATDITSKSLKLFDGCSSLTSELASLSDLVSGHMRATWTWRGQGAGARHHIVCWCNVRTEGYHFWTSLP